MGPLLGAFLLGAALPIAQEPDVQVVVEPTSVELEVGTTRTLRVSVRDAAGAVLRELRPRWFSMTPDILDVDQSGTVTALRPGEGRITAVVPTPGRAQASVAGFASVRVPQLPAETIAVTAPTTRLLAGTSVPIVVNGTTRLGDTLTDLDVTFASDRETVASVDATGRAFAHQAGEATIIAHVGDVTGEVRISVTDSGQARFRLGGPEDPVRTGDVIRFRVDATTVAGDPMDQPVFPEWMVSGVGASIESDGPEGVFVAEAPGTYRVSALVGEGTVESTVVEVAPRAAEARLVTVGRGPASTHHSGDVWVFEGTDGRDYAYIGTFMHDWMKVWDVTDPSQPVLTDSLQLDARRINDVKIHPNNRIGVVTREGASDRRNGFVLLDLTTPAHPTVLSEYDETVTGGVHNVWIDGEAELVYACHNGTSDLHIVDISDPAAPVEVGRWGLQKDGKTLHDVIVQDGYAYLSYWDDGVVMLDVGAGSHGGTPTAPAFVSRYAYPIGNTHVAWRYGRYLFVGDEIFPDDWQADRPIEARGYIHVVDYSDIENPVEVARYEVPEAGAHNVWAEEDKLYVGYYQAGLRVVDISGELRGDLYAQGRELAILKTTDANTTVPHWPMAWGAQIHKGHIYSSDLNSGLWVTKLEVQPRVVF
jgi:hypothetical protein